MITEFFIWVLGGVVSLVASIVDLIPLPDPSAILDPVHSNVATVFANVGALAFWVPFGATGAAIVVVAVVGAAAGGIKLARIVASFLTLGGGSAA